MNDRSRDTRLRLRATEILRENDAGAWTKAAPKLYPHQWSWDAAFVAVGWAHIDVSRAFTELESLFAAQWSTGMVPHIVFDPATALDSYFPGPQRWGCGVSTDAPAPGPATSGICQPPVHAVALARVWEKATTDQGCIEDARRRLGWLFPRMLRWHRYLMTQRDPEQSGLVSIYHPWESGADNAPRWDAVLAGIEVGDLPSYRRRDTAHVTDSTQRPSDADYHRYLWLVELLKQCHYTDESIYRAHPFLVKDVFFSALLVAANQALLELAEIVGSPKVERAEIATWIDRGRRGLLSQFSAELGLCLDYDMRGSISISARTFAGFAPLIAGIAPPDVRDAQLAQLDSEYFLGNQKLRWPLIPTTSPLEPTFDLRRYWRGPVWPVINWVLWRSLHRLGEHRRAHALRQAALDQVAAAGFAEYVEPFTGVALGSDNQSWTAAVVLDWLDSPYS
ncbi:MAG: glycogen debranching protein [Acidimicrobiales bacterium]|nr:MAG: glycogen debranching protein [Acidimicrobiales bacterium]